MIIDSAKYTCAGGHDVNEDSYLCRGDKGIFIVADGLGGHSDGEKASNAAVRYFEESCNGNYTEEFITELMEGANTQVLKNGDGGKTTVAAAFTENGRFIYANAGDSRVYYFHDGKIIAQTKDHSVCQASVDMGLIRPEDIRGNEDRSRLLKVLGGEEKLNIKKHYPPISVQNGDAFLLCTDGFWEYVYETEMEADLLKSDSADIWLKYMLKRQILRAQNKGDNYTAVCGIIHLEDGEVYEDIPVLAKPQKKPASSAKKKKKIPLLPIAAAVAAVAAAAVIILLVLLLGGSNNDEQPTYTTPVHTSAVNVTSTTDTEAATETSAYKTEETTVTSDTESAVSESTAEESTVEESTTAENTAEESTVGESENTENEISESESSLAEASDENPDNESANG